MGGSVQLKIGGNYKIDYCFGSRTYYVPRNLRICKIALHILRDCALQLRDIFRSPRCKYIYTLTVTQATHKNVAHIPLLLLWLQSPLGGCLAHWSKAITPRQGCNYSSARLCNQLLATVHLFPRVQGIAEGNDAFLIDYSVLYDQIVRATLWVEVSLSASRSVCQVLTCV